MRQLRRKSQRRGYVLVVLIVVAALVLAFALAMARLTALDFGRQQQLALTTWADEAVASAQDWSRTHVQELTEESAVRLPLNDLLPPSVTGEVELQRSTSGDTVVVRCRVTLEQGGRRIRREMAWPLQGQKPPARAQSVESTPSAESGIQR